MSPQPPRPVHTASTSLHDAIDARIRSSGRPDLSPDGPTIVADLLLSDGMVAWQEGKAAQSMLGETCWSELDPVYGRYGTDAGRDLITALRQLYDAPAAVVTDCGATACALAIDVRLLPGSHAVLGRQIYGKTRAYLEWVAARVGAEITVVDDVDADTLHEAVRPTTRLVMAETYSNPLTRALDPDAVSDAVVALRAARAPELRLVVDDTIATPWGLRASLLSRPGIDAVVGAGTKALAGRDRDLCGYLVARDIGLANAAMDLQATRGGSLAWRIADDVAAHLDTARALHATRCDNATRLAEALAIHPAVEAVFHPSRPDHPDREVVDRAYARPGSLLAYRLRDADEAATRHHCDVLAMTRVVRYAVSFDGLTTKVNHHTSVSEHFTPTPRLRRQGIDRLVRLSAGVEDVRDLVAALTWALDHGPGISRAEVEAWRDARRVDLGL